MEFPGQEKKIPTPEEIEAALAEIQCEELKKINELYPEIDFTKEVTDDPQIGQFLRKSIAKESLAMTDPLLREDAPKFNQDFSNYFVINNIPIAEEAKVEKLKSLIKTTFKKKNYTVDDTQIDIPCTDGKTEGAAFIKMKNEEEARIGVSIFDGVKLGKSRFATCLMSDFDKMMQIEEDLEDKESADLKDLRAPVLDIKRDQYLYQSGKNVFVNHFSASSATNRSDENTVTVLENASDKPAIWSPQGTYLIVIKADKVIFLGGAGEMRTIITLKMNKCHSVKMSPCERYVLSYTPTNDTCFTVWNFKMAEIIREFDYAQGEAANTYQWSFDGNYLAKQFKTEIENPDGTTKTKEGLSVYSLPECGLLENAEGQKKSITAHDIKEWQWAPSRNLLIYSTVPEAEDANKDPQMTFLSIPKRQNLGDANFKGSTELKMFMHPAGKYLAVQNMYTSKGKPKCSVEVFDLTHETMVPHKIQQIKRDVSEFYGIQWEPVHGRFSVHTHAKRDLEAGKKDYTFGAMRKGIDLYECYQDENTGFNVRLLGFHPSEKVSGVSWSPAGELFAICESEGMGLNSKNVWSTYLIVQGETQGQAQAADAKYLKYKGKLMKVNMNTTQLNAMVDTFEFRKTARHEVPDQQTVGVWDHFGRIFVIHGEKKRGAYIDKEKRSIRFYSMFGESLQQLEKIPELSRFSFRPRPDSILSSKQKKELNSKTLKAQYKKEYTTMRQEDQQHHNEVTRLQKKDIRDEFLNNFYLPRRQEYEDNIEKYINLWPIKDADLSEEPIAVNHIFQYGEVKDQKRYPAQSQPTNQFGQ